MRLHNFSSQHHELSVWKLQATSAARIKCFTLEAVANSEPLMQRIHF